MSDIFAEVDSDLRRDRWQAMWDRYGLLVIGGAAAIVLLVLLSLAIAPISSRKMSRPRFAMKICCNKWARQIARPVLSC